MVKVIWTVNEDKSIDYLAEDKTEGKLPFSFGSTEQVSELGEGSQNWSSVRIMLNSRWCYWLDLPPRADTKSHSELSYLLEEHLPLDAENIQCGTSELFAKEKILVTETEPLKLLIGYAEKFEVDVTTIGITSLELANDIREACNTKNKSIYLQSETFSETFHFKEKKLVDWTLSPSNIHNAQNVELGVSIIAPIESQGHPENCNEKVSFEHLKKIKERVQSRIFKGQVTCNLATGKLESLLLKTQWKSATDFLLLSLIIGLLILSGSFFIATGRERELAAYESTNTDIKIRKTITNYPKRRTKNWLQKQIKSQKDSLRFAKDLQSQNSSLKTLQEFGRAFSLQFPDGKTEKCLSYLKLNGTNFEAKGTFPKVNLFWNEMSKYGFEPPGRKLTNSIERTVFGVRKEDSNESP